MLVSGKRVILFAATETAAVAIHVVGRRIVGHVHKTAEIVRLLRVEMASVSSAKDGLSKYGPLL